MQFHLSGVAPSVTATVDSIFEVLRPALAQYLSEIESGDDDAATRKHCFTVDIRSLARSRQDAHKVQEPQVSVECHVASDRRPLPRPLSTRAAMLDELEALAASRCDTLFGCDANAAPGCIERYAGLDVSDPEREMDVLRYETPGALVAEWVAGAHPHVPFERRLIDGEEVTVTQCSEVADAEDHTRAECDNKGIQRLFGIYSGDSCKPGVIEQLVERGTAIEVLRYETVTDLLAEWRAGRHSRIPFHHRRVGLEDSSVEGKEQERKAQPMKKKRKAQEMEGEEKADKGASSASKRTKLEDGSRSSGSALVKTQKKSVRFSDGDFMSKDLRSQLPSGKPMSFVFMDHSFAMTLP